jgi:hypothetical protein
MPSVLSIKGKGPYTLLQELSDKEDANVNTGVDIPNDPQ